MTRVAGRRAHRRYVRRIRPRPARKPCGGTHLGAPFGTSGVYTRTRTSA